MRDDGVPAGGAGGADDAGRVVAQVEAELDQRVARAADAEAGGGEGGFGGAGVRDQDFLPELELGHVRAARAGGHELVVGGLEAVEAFGEGARLVDEPRIQVRADGEPADAVAGEGAQVVDGFLDAAGAVVHGGHQVVVQVCEL